MSENTQTVVERAREEALDARERFLGGAWNGAYDAYFVRGFEHGATFAATITPEQVEAAARAIHFGYTGNFHEWDEVSQAERFDFRNDARAAFTAAGFQIGADSWKR